MHIIVEASRRPGKKDMYGKFDGPFYLQCQALGDFERVFLGAPFTLEDGVSHDVEGVCAAQATKVDEGHRCPGTLSGCFFNLRSSNTSKSSLCCQTNDSVTGFEIFNTEK